MYYVKAKRKNQLYDTIFWNPNDFDYQKILGQLWMLVPQVKGAVRDQEMKIDTLR